MHRTLAPLSVLVFTLLLAMPVQAVPAGIMPVSEVREGMKGIGKTVISGTLIEDFNIEIIGILERGGFNGGPMILVRGNGPVLDATGGFAGGYSGSPVYINGRMIGAISAAWFFADHSIAGITPIEEMMKNLEYPPINEGAVAGLPQPLAQAVELEGQTLDRLQIASVHKAPPTIEQIATDAANGTLTLTPCRTPLFVNGLNPQLIEQIKEKLGDKLPYMEILPGLGAAGSDTSSPNKLELYPGLMPGAAVGAQLVAGDIDMTAIGTLTYIDEKQVLAFGHPFMQAGAVELPLTKARIVHTMKSIQRSFKMGEATGTVGKIDQDRAAAISGELGELPKMIPFHLTVKDTDLGRNRRYDYSVVDYESILPFLGLLPPIQGLTEVMDRQGPATIRSHFRILTEELEPIERTNLFYDQFSGVGFLELAQGLFLLTTQNIFQEVHLKEVFIDVEVTQNRQTSDIMKAEFAGEDTHVHPSTDPAVTEVVEPAAPEIEKEIAPEPAPLGSGEREPDQEGVEYTVLTEDPGGASGSGADEVRKFRAGDTIRVKVTLKPYRDEQVVETLELKIPADMPEGQTSLEIRGGGRLPSIFQLSPESSGFPAGFTPTVPQAGPPESPDSLEDLIKVFKDIERMNDLVIELYRPGGEAGSEYGGPAPQSTTNMIGGEEASEDDDDGTDERDSASIRNLDATEEDSEEMPIKTTVATDRVIFGTVTLPVEIVGEDDSTEDEGTDTEADHGPHESTEDEDDSDDEEPKGKGQHRDRGYRDNYRGRD